MVHHCCWLESRFRGEIDRLEPTFLAAPAAPATSRQKAATRDFTVGNNYPGGPGGSYMSLIFDTLQNK